MDWVMCFRVATVRVLGFPTDSPPQTVLDRLSRNLTLEGFLSKQGPQEKAYVYLKNFGL